jgi:hypothetical protein
MGLDMYLIVNKKIPFDKDKYTEKFIANQTFNGDLEFTSRKNKNHFIGIYWRKFFNLDDWIFNKILHNDELTLSSIGLIELEKVYDSLIEDKCKNDAYFHLELKKRLNDLIKEAFNDSSIKFQYWQSF